MLALKRDLFEARLLEAKTQRPENHDLLGVGLNGIAISLDDEPYLVVGQSASGRSGRFVRFAGEDQVASVLSVDGSERKLPIGLREICSTSTLKLSAHCD